jgi:hypothetical protein
MASFYCYAECRCAGCYQAECHGAQCIIMKLYSAKKYKWQNALRYFEANLLSLPNICGKAESQPLVAVFCGIKLECLTVLNLFVLV